MVVRVHSGIANVVIAETTSVEAGSVEEVSVEEAGEEAPCGGVYRAWMVIVANSLGLASVPPV